MSVGSKISSLRKERGLTIKDLSVISKIAPGRISQIENDKANPSLLTLTALADALGVDLSALFGPVSKDQLVVRGSDRPLMKSDGKLKHFLLTNREFDNLSFYYRIFEPGFTTSDHPEMHWNGMTGYEFAFVISGKLTCEVEGKTYVLVEGDSICFETQKSHTIKNASSANTEVVWLNLVH